MKKQLKKIVTEFVSQGQHPSHQINYCPALMPEEKGVYNCWIDGMECEIGIKGNFKLCYKYIAMKKRVDYREHIVQEEIKMRGQRNTR